MIHYSPIKLLEFSFQPIRRRYSDVFVVAYKRPLMKPGVLAVLMNLLCFYRGRLLLERYVFCSLQVKTASFFVIKVCFSMFELFKSDFESILLSVRELQLA